MIMNERFYNNLTFILLWPFVSFIASFQVITYWMKQLSVSFMNSLEPLGEKKRI